MQTDRLERSSSTEFAAAEDLLHLQATALEAAANPIIISRRDGTIVWANKAFEELSGYTREEALGQSTRLLKAGQQSPSFYKNMWETILSGQRWRGELVNRRKDGTVYEEEMTITPVKNGAGDVTHFIAIKLDIAERKRAEERICRLAQAVENSAELIAIANPDGRISFANHALLQATGYKDTEIIGELFGKTLLSGNNPPALDEEIRARTIFRRVDGEANASAAARMIATFPYSSARARSRTTGAWSSGFLESARTSPTASVWRNSCSSPRRWRPWGDSRVASPTISIISWGLSWAIATSFWTPSPQRTQDTSNSNKSRKQVSVRRR